MSKGGPMVLEMRVSIQRDAIADFDGPHRATPDVLENPQYTDGVRVEIRRANGDSYTHHISLEALAMTGIWDALWDRAGDELAAWIAQETLGRVRWERRNDQR